MHRPFPTVPSAKAVSAGFSLPEVAMAIGIIAIAFVALIGLLPVGLNTYRAAIDEANQSWIMQSMNSMVQTTDFAHVEELDYKVSNEIYYFDEEGALIDRATTSNGDVALEVRRIYAVKLLVNDMNRPGTASEKMEHGWRVLVVMAPYTNPEAMKDFNNLGSINDLEQLKQNTQLKTRAIVVARMDSQSRTGS